MLCSIMGFSPTLSIGLGILFVKGNKRLPSPPAKITASIGKYVLTILKFIILTKTSFSSKTGTSFIFFSLNSLISVILLWFFLINIGFYSTLNNTNDIKHGTQLHTEYFYTT